MTPTASEVSDDIPRISVWELHERLQGGESVVVVDTRSAANYEMEHIPGAISIPADQIELQLNGLPRDQLIVFY